jgi:hypothetical protein
MTEPVFEDDTTIDYTIEEKRRIDSLDRAGRIAFNGIDDYLEAAVKVEKYLATGKIKNKNDPDPVV